MKHFNQETFNTIIHLLEPYLERFVKVKDGLYNFRCPICGDSQKNSLKRRAYIYTKGDKHNFYCHNCLYSTSLYNFIKNYYPFILQSLKLSEVFFNNIQKQKDLQWANDKKETLTLPLYNVQTLPDNHIALQYIIQRKIPQSKWGIIYYSDNLIKELQCPFDKGLVFKECDNLLVIRNLDSSSKTRYFVHRISEDILFNVKNIDKESQVIIVEGLIDSLFLDNAIPSLNSNLISTSNRLIRLGVKKENIVLVWDNEPFNSNIVNNIQKAIAENFKVFIPPKGLTCKDINEMVLNNIEPNEMVNNNVHYGIEARLKFNLWKRV